MVKELKQRFDGRFLQDLRKANGITLEALAHAVGTSKGYIWELENGGTKKPSFEVVAKLAFVLDVKMETFILKTCPREWTVRNDVITKRKLPTLRTMKIMRELRNDQLNK